MLTLMIAHRILMLHQSSTGLMYVELKVSYGVSYFIKSENITKKRITLIYSYTSNCVHEYRQTSIKYTVCGNNMKLISNTFLIVENIT